jgi:hypothetical protein
MFALIASAALGLYIFLPDFLFDKLAAPFAELKRHQRTKLEEITAGVVVAAIPFALTWFLSQHVWLVGHWPFAVNEAVTNKVADYKLIFAAAYRDEFFIQNQGRVWDALSHVRWHQLRFLCWNYFFLLLEISVVIVLTSNYGRWKNNWFYRQFITSWLLRRVSEWEILLTSFVFPPSERRIVVVDAMTSDGHLYSGNAGAYFLDREGDLSGLLLKNCKRFRYAQLQEDRQRAEKPIETQKYWTPIPGANFYISSDKIVTLNIRYEPPPGELVQQLSDVLKNLRTGLTITMLGAEGPPKSPARRPS